MRRAEEVWMNTMRPGDVSGLMQRFGLSDVCARILWNRGYRTEEAVAAFLAENASAEVPKLSKTDAFVRVMREAIDEGRPIRVVGDYDVDGVTGTFLLVNALRSLNVKVDYRIPDRVTDGYGISAEMVRAAAFDGIGTIVTVDNGIAAVRELNAAKGLGIRTIVTDHHEPLKELPGADCIVDPKLDGDPDAKVLCGAVVAAALADALLASYGEPGYFAEHAEILALATICDVMELTGAARAIVRAGLKKPLGKWNRGLQMLASCAGISAPICTYDLSFVIGPCINSLGRLETADYGVELLLAKNDAACRESADRMVRVNSERKEQTKYFTELAIAEAARSIEAAGGDMPVLVLPMPQCHESIIGIVAGRVRETYFRPTFVLAESANGSGLWKGSGRSVEGFCMVDALKECGDILERYGGHAMAAGITIRSDCISEFRERLAGSCRKSGVSTKKTARIDLVMPFSYATADLVRELGRMEPFGNGNPRPVFAQKGVVIREIRYMGKNSEFLRFTLTDAQGTSMRAVSFDDAQEFLSEMTEACGEDAVDAAFEGRGRADCAILYHPEINSYNDREYLQLRLDGYHFTKKQA
ncbi:MAG: single-stranded-DNA-specific exonuclease RecJ [Lachnospiraceae bacterium]|nr:single-stranded-DNA-specific exonuclease RecJ [Lachnospiraceae bacterium]